MNLATLERASQKTENMNKRWRPSVPKPRLTSIHLRTQTFSAARFWKVQNKIFADWPFFQDWISLKQSIRLDIFLALKVVYSWSKHTLLLKASSSPIQVTENFQFFPWERGLHHINPYSAQTVSPKRSCLGTATYLSILALSHYQMIAWYLSFIFR